MITPAEVADLIEELRVVANPGKFGALPSRKLYTRAADALLSSLDRQGEAKGIARALDAAHPSPAALAWPPIIEMPNGLKIQIGGCFKLVCKEEFMQLSGPIKGRIPEERRAAQLIREAWNKLPDTPTMGGEAASLDEVGGQVRGPSRATPESPSEHDAGKPHLVGGEFQSDKYPTTPRGKVPLSCRDTTAQDLLWEYAQRRRVVDTEFAADLEEALTNAGYRPSPSDRVAKMGNAKELRDALKPFADIGLARDQEPDGPDCIAGPDLCITPTQVRRARAALSTQGETK